MRVPKACHRVTAVEVQNLAPVAGVQPHAFTMGYFDGVLSEHLGQVARVGRCYVGRCQENLKSIRVREP
jgi:hypothetical protein